MLVLLLLLPLVGAAVVLLLPQAYSRAAALGFSGLSLLLVLVISANGPAAAASGPVDWPWMTALGARFALNDDGLSKLLLLLVGLLYPLILLVPPAHHHRLRLYYGLLLLMQAPLFGVFVAADALLFYVFYELALVPAYFLIVFWGGEGSRRITLKFFIYTIAGSLFLLVSVIYLYFRTPEPHSFSFPAFYGLQLSGGEQRWLFAAMFFGFAVKIPVFPFHTWQPDTYTVAPAAGSMVLAGLMLKMGIYGLMRFVVPVVPEALASWGWFAVLLCVISTLYGSLVALRQNDVKRLVAYSSLGHVGLIAAGVLAGNASGMQGAAVQMFNHGINVVALFFAVDIIERRYGTRQVAELGGIAGQMRHFSWLFAIVVLGSVGLPLTNGFVGELLLLNGLYQFRAGMAIAAGFSVVLSVAYLLRWYRLAFFGNARHEGRGDLHGTELAVLLACCLLIIGIGTYPRPLLQLTEPVVTDLLSFLKHKTALLLP